MDDSVWRLRAKVAAIVDLILISVCVVITILYVVLLGNGVNTAVSNGSLNATMQESQANENMEARQSVTSMAYWILALTLAVSVAVIGVQFWAAIKLLKAATIRTEPRTAQKMAQFWRNVTIVIILLYVIWYAIKLYILGIVVIIVWKGIPLYIVHRFIGEQRSFSKSGNRCPENVIIRK